MKKLSSSVAALVFCLGAWAETETVDGIEWFYTVENGNAIVGSKWAYDTAIPKSTVGKIRVPSSLGGYPVVRVGGYAFYLCTELTSVDIPSTVNAIGASAFFGCSKLEHVTIPSSLSRFGAHSFYDCTNLEQIHIPATVTEIGKYAFHRCKKFTSIEIPPGVKTIGESAFASCNGVETLTIHEGVTSIERCAFAGCEKLTWVQIPIGVTSIGELAFSLNSRLTAVRIPPSIQSIGKDAFSDCSKLSKIYVDDMTANRIKGLIGSLVAGQCSFIESSMKPPVFSPESGTIFEGLMTVDISCQEGKVYYTTDGSTPTSMSVPYSRFKIDSKTTVKAIAYSEGRTPSSVSTAQYALGTCENPIFVLPTGIFSHSGQEIEIQWNESDGILRYTLDGRVPTEDSSTYEHPIKIDDTTTICAKVFSDRYFDSQPIWATYTREWITVETPVINAPKSFSGSGVEVAISCETEGAVIRYTTDGSTPNSHSQKYTAPFIIGESCIIKALAQKEDCNNSDVASASVEKVWGIGDALNDPDRSFDTVAPGGWIRDAKTSHDGVECMRSGRIGNAVPGKKMESALSTLVKGKGVVSFYWKASCESDDELEWDHGEFRYDGEVKYINGEGDWHRVEIALKSDCDHVLTWVYVKDDFGSEGSDCIWVDEFVWTPTEPIPDIGIDATRADVLAALSGSADEQLLMNITDAKVYGAYREWALKIGAAEVKASPFSWASFATDSAALLAKMPTDEDLKVEEFKPSATTGSFDFTISVKDVTIGDKASGDNLKKLFGLEGAESLDSAAFSFANVALEFKEPQDGKLKFTATPAIKNVGTFFMKMKVKQSASD